MHDISQLPLPGLVADASILLPLVHTRRLEDFCAQTYSPSANPALTSFITNHASAAGRSQDLPLAEDLVAGKNTYVYDAHTYHTKVPPEAIAHLIEHYTDEGDLVLDPFCGSGMTGVAALRTGRIPILIDLSPAATFIALNFLTPIQPKLYRDAFMQVLNAVSAEEMTLYRTRCRRCGKLVPMEYMVWSYSLECPHCGKDFVLWDVARDEHDSVRDSKIRAEFDCPYCREHLKKRHLHRTRLSPVQVGYYCCEHSRQESKATPDDFDFQVLAECESLGIPSELWYPNAKLPPGVNTRQAIAHGLTSIDRLYTTRALRAVARLWDTARRWPDDSLALKLMFTVTSLYQRVTRLSEFRFWGGSGNIANYNVPMIFNEQNVYKTFYRKARTIMQYMETWDTTPRPSFCLSTQSATDLTTIPDDAIDYVVTDPPFGRNINYSEMNFLWEAWLGAFTNPAQEAIMNEVQGKAVDEYRRLLESAFREIHRVLKPGRWLTVMFHNSSARVWSAIQNALSSAGFTIQETHMMDKRHGTFKQFVSKNAVGYDLLLHCRKIPVMQPLPQPVPALQDRADIAAFIDATLGESPDEFVIHYLHVDRPDEVDGRRLYSLWLKQRLETGGSIDLDHEQFRKILDQTIESARQRAAALPGRKAHGS